MPERPRSHRLEDESRRAFEAAVEPRFKFYSRPQPEYGIDGEVEEFDEADRATGLHFFVQLKGTDEPEIAKALGVDIKLDTANYYRAAPLPVLMVRYHAPTHPLYVRWFHQYDPYEGRGGTKTLSFRWQRGDAWQDNSPEGLAGDARAFLELRRASLRLPRPVHLVTTGAFGLTPAEISIALRAAANERADVLEVRSGSPPPGAAWIEVRDEEIRADLAKVTAATLHFDGQDREREHDAERVAVDALTMVALAFERLGQDDIASRLASTYFARSSLATNLDAAFALSSSMARAHRIAESLELSEELDDPSNESLEGAATVFGFPALYKARSLSQSEVTQHEQVLKQRAKRRKKSHPVAAGRAYMNLAGLQRSRNNWDAATSYYELALKLDPAYQHRAHYWYEYGGALWGTGQFAKGADSYRRSIELGTTEPLAVALEADCLMFAGKYAGALDLFDAFTKEHPEDDGEYRLKARAVRAVVERLEIHEQERRPFRAVEAAEGDEPHTASEWAQVSLKQLAVDALWGSAWLNLGIADFEQGHLDQALDSFVAATILIVEDYETWDNAIVTAFSLGESDVLTDLVVSGRRMGGDALIASVIDFAKRPGSVIPLNEFGARIDGILAEHSPGVRSGFTVRMLREDGSVEEVVIQDEPDEPSPQGPATSSSG